MNWVGPTTSLGTFGTGNGKILQTVVYYPNYMLTCAYGYCNMGLYENFRQKLKSWHISSNKLKETLKQEGSTTIYSNKHSLSDDDLKSLTPLEEASLENVLHIWESFIEENDKVKDDMEDQKGEQADDDIQKERQNQLERRLKRKKRRKSLIKDPFASHKDANAPSLDSLISSSACADQIYNLIAKADLPNGNPLLGMQILLKLSPQLQQECFHLIHFPKLIVEYLLMTQKVVELSTVFNSFEELRFNELIMEYARKAVEFVPYPAHLIQGRTVVEWREYVKVNNRPETPPHDYTIIRNSTEFVIVFNYNGAWSGKLTGTDLEKDKEARMSHFFTGGTPNQSLAISLINLTKLKKIGQNVIDLCDYLSEKICELEPDDQILATKIIAELFSYAKSLFLQENNLTKVSLCDSYLRDIDLLRTLVQSKCSFKLSLIDLGDPQKIKYLRDSLVRENLLDLAFSVTAHYNLNPERVWAAWGLQLLRSGQFEVAKDKLKYCFTSRATRISVVTLLQEIIEVLEMLPAETTGAQKPKTFTDETYDIRYDQCIFYLSEYGSPLQLIKFLVRHKKIEECIRLVIAKSQSPTIFSEDIAGYSAKYNMMKEFTTAISKLDPGVVLLRDHLMNTCNYFHKKSDFGNLLLCQELLGDYARAALTCIKLYMEDTSFSEGRDEYLEQSKHHFLEELKAMQNKTSSNVLPESEINKYIKKLKLQSEIGTYLRSLDSVPDNVKSMNVFGTVKQRSELAEKLLEYGNHDLGCTVIMSLQLPVAPILRNVVLTLVKRNDMKQVEEFIQRGKNLPMTDEEWDNFLVACVKIFNDASQTATANKLVEYIKNELNMIDALILCGKLKKAYLTAVKTGQKDKVVKIKDEAQLRNMQTEYRLCEKYLALGATSTSSSSLLEET